MVLLGLGHFENTLLKRWNLSGDLNNEKAPKGRSRVRASGQRKQQEKRTVFVEETEGKCGWSIVDKKDKSRVFLK